MNNILRVTQCRFIDNQFSAGGNEWRALSRTVTGECVANPGDVFCIEFVEQQGVEAARSLRMGVAQAFEPPARGGDDALLFVGRNAVGGAAEAVAAAQTDFDEYKGFLVETDKIDFAAAPADVARHRNQFVVMEKLHCQLFRKLPAPLRVRCRTVDNVILAGRCAFRRGLFFCQFPFYRPFHD